MRKFSVSIDARKEGAIGAMGTEHRTYTVEAPTLDDVNRAAIDAAYKEGGLEHVRVWRVVELGVGDGAHNPNCDGAHCRTAMGEVRVFPLGQGGNLILCHACFANENRYRRERGRETGQPENWPQVNWYRAKGYDRENGCSYESCNT